ncbi:ribbon-helix-helix domain-containing protein [Scytonema sp. PCC 10023]|uniref:ribbon-helix-helix domain-containing protein n=1 Tax=Scytonema sp. PCC 10023 TaxID=1680591 RepID=UPI0039C5E6A3
MSKRISVVLPDDIGELVEQMASGEMRSLSQMGAILIMEAVKARQENETPTPTSKKKNKGAA